MIFSHAQRNERADTLRERLGPSEEANAGEVRWLLKVEELARVMTRSSGVVSANKEERRAMVADMREALRNLNEWRLRIPEFKKELAEYDDEIACEKSQASK